MRCLAIAQALVDEGHTAILASAAMVPGVARRFAEEGVEILTVGRAAGEEGDLELTHGFASAGEVDWVLVDGYDFSPRYLESLAEQWRVMFIDDLGRRGVHVSSVLNANVYATERLYPDRGDECRLLLGPRYAPLRREFRAAPRRRSTRNAAQNLLVSLGGSDPDNVTARVVTALAGRGIGKVRVVVGAGHPDPRAAGAGAGIGFTTLHDVRSLLPHLRWADIVVGAGGTTALEYAFAGLPALLLVLADNQAAVAKGLERAGVGIDIGVPDSAMEQRLLTELDRISADPVTRRHMSESGQELVDGQGADRVLATMSPPLELRPATRDDAELLLRWANDRGVRKASFDPRPIDWDEHVAWLEARLRDPFSRIWVALDGKTPVGVARFALEGDRATISVTVTPERRGRRVGTSLIATSVERLLNEERIAGIDAWVRPENTASIHAFQAAGFELRSSVPRRGVPPAALLLGLERAKRG